MELAEARKSISQSIENAPDSSTFKTVIVNQKGNPVSTQFKLGISKNLPPGQYEVTSSYTIDGGKKWEVLTNLDLEIPEEDDEEFEEVQENIFDGKSNSLVERLLAQAEKNEATTLGLYKQQIVDTHAFYQKEIERIRAEYELKLLNLEDKLNYKLALEQSKQADLEAARRDLRQEIEKTLRIERRHSRDPMTGKDWIEKIMEFMPMLLALSGKPELTAMMNAMSSLNNPANNQIDLSELQKMIGNLPQGAVQANG